MTSQELQTQISKLDSPYQWEVEQTYKPGLFHLRMTGKVGRVCVDEPMETILWIVANPKAWEAQQDALLEELLNELSEV